jgi:cobalt/nickel transport system ATP-binding protein
MLEFLDVEYNYPGNAQRAIQGLSLNIPQGRRCGLIGQNGCGKTTLFLLANGLYKPQAGTIRWQGQPIKYDRSRLMQLRQQVGLVFQNPENQLVASTVEEDISYGLCNLGRSEREIAQRVQQSLVDFYLTELAHQPIHNLSLGQKKRVSIADVMVLQPQLLLLDEPTAYLDPRHTRELSQQLQQIHALGTTILLASHDLDFIYRWADWVFVMDQGRLVLEGTPEQVFAQRDRLEQLQLGVPLAISIMDQVNSMIAQDPSITPTQLEQQILRWQRSR